LYVTERSQWRDLRTGVMWQDFGVLVTARAREFWSVDQRVFQWPHLSIASPLKWNFFVWLCSSWQDFIWRNSSCGCTVIGEIFVLPRVRLASWYEFFQRCFPFTIAISCIFIMWFTYLLTVWRICLVTEITFLFTWCVCSEEWKWQMTS